jgi:hypothetical protein
MNPVRNSSEASNPARIILEPDPAEGKRPITSDGVNRWEHIDVNIERVEQTLIVTFLSFMILIAFLQIVLHRSGLGGPTLKKSGSLDRFHRGYPCHQGGKTYQHRYSFEVVAFFG